MKTKQAFLHEWKYDRRWLVETSIWGMLSLITFGFFCMALVLRMADIYFASGWLLSNFTGFMFWLRIGKAL